MAKTINMPMEAFGPPIVDADKTHDPGFTKQEFKQGFSRTPMYRDEYSTPCNSGNVRDRRWRKEREDKT